MENNTLLYEYAVIRYVPRVEREEFINIGLLMMCKKQRWIGSAIDFDDNRIMAFDPKVRIAALRLQAEMFLQSGVPAPHMVAEERYRWLTAVKSAVLQVSPSHPGIILCNSPLLPDESIRILEKEFKRLFSELVKI